MLKVTFLLVMSLAGIGRAQETACELMDFITMHMAQFTEESVTKTTYYYPNATSAKKAIVSVCKDLDRLVKLRCGFGSETNISLAIFEEDVCVGYRSAEDIVTARIYKDEAGGYLNIDLVYSKDETGHFIIVNFRSVSSVVPNDISFEEKHYDFWFRAPLTASVYTIGTDRPVFVTEKKNFISHTYLNWVETGLSVFLHVAFAYGTLLHNRHTYLRLRRLRPFAIYLSGYLALRILGWLDGLYYYWKGVQHSDWMVTALYFALPALSIYYVEAHAGKATLDRVLVPLYICIGVADFIILLLFISTGLAIIGMAAFLFYICMPLLTSNLIADSLEWVVSFAFVLELFVQHLLWFPFKKIGALRLYLHGLEPYYLSNTFLAFGVSMVVFLFPVGCLRYKISLFMTQKNEKFHRQKRLEGSIPINADSPVDILTLTPDDSH